VLVCCWCAAAVQITILSQQVVLQELPGASGDAAPQPHPSRWTLPVNVARSALQKQRRVQLRLPSSSVGRPEQHAARVMTPQQPRELRQADQGGPAGRRAAGRAGPQLGGAREEKRGAWTAADGVRAVDEVADFVDGVGQVLCSALTSAVAGCEGRQQKASNSMI